MLLLDSNEKVTDQDNERDGKEKKEREIERNRKFIVSEGVIVPTVDTQ